MSCTLRSLNIVKSGFREEEEAWSEDSGAESVLESSPIRYEEGWRNCFNCAAIVTAEYLKVSFLSKDLCTLRIFGDIMMMRRESTVTLHSVEFFLSLKFVVCNCPAPQPWHGNRVRQPDLGVIASFTGVVWIQCTRVTWCLELRHLPHVFIFYWIINTLRKYCQAGTMGITALWLHFITHIDR